MAAGKGGRGKRSRSEIVTVRLDPKLRFAAELAARKQRRTLSSLVEWAIEYSLARYDVRDQLSALELADLTWDVDEADRFVELAFACPELLTHDEQVLWKLIRENGWVWVGAYDRSDEWTWKVRSENLRKDELRRNWETFRNVAAGELGTDKLPQWMRKRGGPGQKGLETQEDETYIDDDIPF